MITKNEMTTMSINDLAHLIDATDEVIRKKQNELSAVPEWQGTPAICGR